MIKFIYDHRQDKATLDRPTFFAAVRAAQELKMKIVAHIGTWEDAKAALDAGVTAITHFDDDEVIPDSLVAQWKKQKVISIPTMAVQSDLALFVEKPEILNSPLLKQLTTPSGLLTYRNPKKFTDRARSWIEAQQDDRNNDTKTFKKLLDAGVIFLAGSDSNNLGTFQGFSLHREMWLLRQAGLGPWETLSSATHLAATFLGRDDGIREGAKAEFVVLYADPIANVANTQKIFGVYHREKWVKH